LAIWQRSRWLPWCCRARGRWFGVSKLTAKIAKIAKDEQLSSLGVLCVVAVRAH
jgi:hypothetical protein